MHISDELRQYVADNPQVDKVYFDRVGNHHFNVHRIGNKFYSRQRQAWEEDREDYEICEILTRQEILEQELEELIERDHKPKMCPVLTFQYFLNNKNLNFMAIISNLTLTSTAPQTFKMNVNDANNNLAPIAGTLTGLSYNADAAQDIAVVDPNDPLSVDIHAVAPTGGTTVTATGNFVSTLQKTDGSGPAFSGTVTGTLVIVNNVAVAVLNPVLTFNK